MIEITYQDSATPIQELNCKADTLQFELVDNILMEAEEWAEEEEHIIFGAPSLNGGDGSISGGEVIPVDPDTYNTNDFRLREFSYIYIPETNEVEFSFICPSGRSLTKSVYIKVKDSNFISPTYKTFELGIHDDDGAVGYDRKVIFRYSFDNSNIREIYNSIVPSKYTPIVGGSARKSSSSNKYVTKSSYENIILSENIENHLLDDKGRLQRTEEHYYKIIKTLRIKSNSLIPNAAGNYYSSKSELTDYREEYLLFQGECSYDLYDEDRNLLKENVQETTPYILMRCTVNPQDSLVGKIKLPMDQTYNLYYRGVVFYEDFDGNIQEVVSSNYVNIERFKLAEITPSVDNPSYSENGYPLFIVGSQKGEKISFKVKVNKVLDNNDQYVYPDITSITSISTTDQSNNGLSEYEDPNNGLFQVGINNKLWDRQPDPGYDNWRISSDNVYYDKNTGQITLYVIAQQTNDELDPWRPQYSKILPLLATTTISYTYNDYLSGDDVIDGGWFATEDSVTVSYYVVQKSSHLGIKPVQYDSASSSTYEFCESDNNGHYLVTVPSTPGIRKVFLGIVSEVDPYSSIVENWNIEETSLDDREYFFENYSGGYNDKIVLYTSINKEPPDGDEYATLHSFRVSDHIIHSTIWRRAIYESTVEIIPIIYPQKVDLGLLSYKITGCTSKFFYKKYRLFFFNNDEKEHEFRLVFERNGDPGVDPTNFTIDSKYFIAGNTSDATDNDGYTYHVASETEDGELTMTISRGIPTSEVKIIDIIKKENVDLNGKINEVIIKLKYPDETSITDPGINFMKTSDSLPLSFELGFGFDGGYAAYSNQSIKFYCAQGVIKSLGVQKPETQEVFIPAAKGQAITSIPISTLESNGAFPTEEVNIISPIIDEDFNNWDFTTSSKYFNFSDEEDEYRRIIGQCQNPDFDFEYCDNSSIGTLLVQGKSNTGGTDLVNFFRVSENLSESLNNWKFYVYNSLPAQFNFTSAEGSSRLIIKEDENTEISDLTLRKLGIYRVYVTIRTGETQQVNGTLSARLSGTNSDKILFNSYQPTLSQETGIDLDFSGSSESKISNNPIGTVLADDLINSSNAIYFNFLGLSEDFNSNSIDDLRLIFKFVDEGGNEIEKALRINTPISESLKQTDVRLDYYINNNEIIDGINHEFPVGQEYIWIPVNSEENWVGKVVLDINNSSYPYRVFTGWVPAGKERFLTSNVTGSTILINSLLAETLGELIFNVENEIELNKAFNQDEEIFNSCYLTNSLKSQRLTISINSPATREWNISVAENTIVKQYIDLTLLLGPIKDRGDIKSTVRYLPPIGMNDVKLKSGAADLTPFKLNSINFSSTDLKDVCKEDNNYPMSPKLVLSQNTNSTIQLVVQGLDYITPLFNDDPDFTWMYGTPPLQALAQICEHSSYPNLTEDIESLVSIKRKTIHDSEAETNTTFELTTLSNSYAAKLSVALGYTTYSQIAIAKLDIPFIYYGIIPADNDSNSHAVIDRYGSRLLSLGWFKIGQKIDYNPIISDEIIPSIPSESFKKTIRIPARFFAERNGSSEHEIIIQAKNDYSQFNQTKTTHIIAKVTARGIDDNNSLGFGEAEEVSTQYGACPFNQYVVNSNAVIEEDVYLDLKFNEVVYTVYNDQMFDGTVGHDDCYRLGDIDHVFHVTNPDNSTNDGYGYFPGGVFSPDAKNYNRSSAGLVSLMGGTIKHTITLLIDGKSQTFQPSDAVQNGYDYYIYMIGANGVSQPSPNPGNYTYMWFYKYKSSTNNPLGLHEINALYIFPTRQFLKTKNVNVTFSGVTQYAGAGPHNLAFCKIQGRDTYLLTNNYTNEWVVMEESGIIPEKVTYTSDLWDDYGSGADHGGSNENGLTDYYWYCGGTWKKLIQGYGTITVSQKSYAHIVDGYDLYFKRKLPNDNPDGEITNQGETLMTIHTRHGGS